MGKSRIESVMEARTQQRKSAAVERTLAALCALERSGMRAWVVGSLAKGGFGLHSDVDLLVECDTDSEARLFKIVEAEMRDFPFHLIPTCTLDEDKLSYFMGEAVDASGIRACA
jgi:predicted nucleotidyltransferase